MSVKVTGLGHSVYCKSMQKTITMQGLKLASITAAEKHTLMQRLH